MITYLLIAAIILEALIIGLLIFFGRKVDGRIVMDKNPEKKDGELWVFDFDDPDHVFKKSYIKLKITNHISQ